MGEDIGGRSGVCSYTFGSQKSKHLYSPLNTRKLGHYILVEKYKSIKDMAPIG